MIGDPWPEEPEDPYPEYLDPFPAYSEPVRPASAGRTIQDGHERAVPPAIQTGMLALLGIVRIGIFALALGPMLFVLAGETYYGQVITTIGVVTLAYAAHRYLVYQDIVQRL